MKKIAYLCMIFMSCNSQLPPLDNLFECPEQIAYRKALNSGLSIYSDDVVLYGYKPFSNTDYIFQFDKIKNKVVNTNVLIIKKYASFSMDSLYSLQLENKCSVMGFDTLSSSYFSFNLTNTDACEFKCYLSLSDSTVLSCSYRF